MSVSVQGLTKHYGAQVAVNQISFSVEDACVAGFLGPNGAGKSTTMKMLTCFLPPTGGTATVCGSSILEKPDEVKRQIGYLPEHNPLYPEMYVREYLEFCARVYRLKNFSKRIDEMIELTGLVPERKKRIGQLSKGYRQRVGLAQALLHDPKTLILDEPTSGLDPNQLVGIRDLIISLGKTKTVILSTHIMQEVQAMCQRVIVIDRGKIVADGSVSELESMAGNGFRITAEFARPVNLEPYQNLEKNALRTDADGRLLHFACRKDIRGEIFQLAAQNNHPLIGLWKEKEDLETVFRQLTQPKN